MSEDRNARPVGAVFEKLIRRVNQLNENQQLELLKIIETKWGKGRRENDRREFFMTVDYVVDGRSYRDFIQDMSSSGVFIRTRQRFQVGRHVSMTFMSPDLKTPFKIAGEITRTLEYGIGVKFVIESEVQKETLEELVNHIQPDLDTAGS